MTAMRIGIDFSHNLSDNKGEFYHSGIGTYTRELVMAMSKLDPLSEFHIFTRLNRACQLEQAFCGFENIRIREALPDKKILGNRMKPLVKKVISGIWKELSTSVDVLHFTEPVHFHKEVSNAVVTLHDFIRLNHSSFPEKQRLKYMTASIIGNSRRIIVPSHYVKKELSRLFPGSACKVDVIYEGAKRLFSPQPASAGILSKYGIPFQKPFFLSVGRIEQRKNLHNQLSAYHLLPENIRRNTGFVMIGNGSPRDVEELSNLAARLGITGSVHLLQGVPDEDLVHFYNAALALLFVSFSEGFGLPLVEAMNCGCPSIISNVTSLPEVAEDTALLTDPTDLSGIASCMRKLCDDQALRMELGRKSLERAKTFSWEEAARETLLAYDHAVG